MAFLIKRFTRSGYYWYLAESKRIKGKVIQKILKYIGKTRDAYFFAIQHGIDLPKEKTGEETKFDEMLDAKIRLKYKQIGKKEMLKIVTSNEMLKRLLLEWTYHSTVIEGSSLTLRETRKAMEGKEIPGKPVEDSKGAKGHKDAILYMLRLLEKKQRLAEQDVLDIHSLVMNGIPYAMPGRYRNTQVMIAGAIHKPPPASHVRRMIAELIKMINENPNKLDPISLSAIAHLEFERIHPFIDGNGRVGRILQNYLLMSAGYPPIVIKINERKRYFEALEESEILGRPDPFIRFIKIKVLKAYDSLKT
jgi:Fic family protein